MKGRAAPPVPKELAEIIRSASSIAGHRSLEDHLQAVRQRRAQECECFLRACALRLGIH